MAKKSAPLVDPPLVCPYSRPSISGTPCDMKGVSIAVVPCDMEGPSIAVVVVTKWVRCPRVGPGVRARLRTRPVYNRGGREWRELPREDHFRTGFGPVLDSTYVPGGVRGAGASPGEPERTGEGQDRCTIGGSGVAGASPRGPVNDPLRTRRMYPEVSGGPEAPHRLRTG